MGVISGKTGAISFGGSAVSSTAEWTIEDSVATTQASASNTAGGKITSAGVRDWKGSFRSYARINPIDPGSSGAFIGYTGGGRASGTILVTSIDMTADLENLTPLVCNTEFEGSGALTYPATTTLSDSTDPALYVPSGGKFNWQPLGQSDATVPVCRSWNIKVNCEAKPYTPEASGWRSKLAGDFSATITASFYEADITKFVAAGTLMVPGTIGIVKCYVDGTNYYGFTYATVISKKPLAPIETGDPPSVEFTFGWSSYANVGGTWTKGAIAKPVSGNIWS